MIIYATAATGIAVGFAMLAIAAAMPPRTPGAEPAHAIGALLMLVCACIGAGALLSEVLP
jgi:hypothetical protein